MKIILALFGFFVAARCLPSPQTQTCVGGQCNQNNVNAQTAAQNCDAQCNQNNQNTKSDAPFADLFPDTKFEVFNQQRTTAQCIQNNAGRKKRATVQVRRAD